MYEELASSREVVDLSPSMALDKAEYFLVEQGYVVVQRTATTLTVEREGSEITAGQEGAPKVVVMAVPQPDGGVRIRVRGTDREGVRERQALWELWIENLPKRQHQKPPAEPRVAQTSHSEREVLANTPSGARQGVSLSRNMIILGATLAALVVVVALVGLAISVLSEPVDATEVVQGLKDEGMPIGESRTYTAENDPNELVGRPGQYTSKVTFKDTRLERDQFASEFDVQNGGSVEVFENEDDAIRRAEYVEAIAKSFGPFNEYAFREGTVLLRLSHRLTPLEADEYETALREAL